MKGTDGQFFVLCFAIKEVVKVSLGDCSGVGDGGIPAHREDRRQQRRAADDSAQCKDALPRTCPLESTSSSGCYSNSILQILAASCCRRPGWDSLQQLVYVPPGTDTGPGDFCFCLCQGPFLPNLANDFFSVPFLIKLCCWDFSQLFHQPVRLSTSSVTSLWDLPEKIPTGILEFLVAQTEGEAKPQLEWISIVPLFQVDFGHLMLAEEVACHFLPKRVARSILLVHAK